MIDTSQGCEFCKWSPLRPSQMAEIARALGAQEVRGHFAIEWLANEFAAMYEDGTYQAIRLDQSNQTLRELNGDPEWVIEALRKAPRRERRPQDCLVFESY